MGHKQKCSAWLRAICDNHIVVLSVDDGHGSSSPKLLRAAHIAAVTTMFVKQPPRVGCSHEHGI
jgi:hypothetical protein